MIGVYEQRWGAPRGPLCVYLHGVGDPGNVGTVLRSAQAFGASSVALGPGCADPHSPKAVRASMGAIFAVPLARGSATWRAAGAADRAVRGRAGGRCADAPPTAPTDADAAVGAERDGLPAERRRGLRARTRASRSPRESLNAAMAATVALYEMTRRAI